MLLNLSGWACPLCQMHDACGEECCAYQNDKAAKQGAPFDVERIEQGAHRGRVAGQLEGTHHTKHQLNPQVGG
jgi:hypothetical protein